ncbi:MAG: hypothetical protein ACLFV7_03960 [Phycisphaerae bacterium]
MGISRPVVLAFTAGLAVGASVLALAGSGAEAVERTVTEKAVVLGGYQPAFAEHVTAHVRRQYCFQHALGSVFCSSPVITDDGRVRWTITGEVNRGSGEFYYDNWQRAKRDLQRDVKLWQKRGYDIKYADFVIEVREPRGKWGGFGSES